MLPNIEEFKEHIPSAYYKEFIMMKKNQEMHKKTTESDTDTE